MENSIKITATELERQVMELEEIKIVVRCARNDLVDPYPYSRKSATTTSLTEWYQQRLKPLIAEYDADIIDGSGVTPHGRTQIEKIRSSYAKE